MKKSCVVVGATGDVGRGIVRALLARGHAVAAVARQSARLDALAVELGHPAGLCVLSGSIESDEHARALLGSLRDRLPAPEAVVISVNAPRRPAPLMTHTSDSLVSVLRSDLIAHYTAARAFVPALARGGVLLGIGGGSCDFILEGGVPQSIGQAGLRQLYRGLAHEHADGAVHVRQLIIASIVNGVTTRARAAPEWVTDLEIGSQAAAILEDPASFPGPILRLARRDSSGQPVFSSEPATRVQGFG